MWYEYLYRVLSIINYVVLIVIAIPIVMQVLYILLGFLPKKRFPKSEKKGRIAYLIPAHNEAGVIYGTVKAALENQNYPKELYDVYVVAHNCTDDTAELARKAGAKVLVLNDPDPAHRMALYPLKHGVREIISLEGEAAYDMIVHLDADNRINAEFSSLMNDAYQAGVDFARPYEGALNGMQNFYTKASAMLYAFDSRFGSRVRERLHLAAHVNGSGAMMSVRMLKETGGYDCETMCDDAEFNMKRMFDGHKGHFVEDAVVYEDMPSSWRDTLNRNKRMGSGATNLFKANAGNLWKHFFRTGDFSFLEVYFLFSLSLLNVLLGVWLPIYYIYHFVFLGFAGYGGMELALFPVEFYRLSLWNTLFAAAGIAVGLFILFGYIQGLILALTDYKKLGAKNRRALTGTVLGFPAFLVLYGITLMAGTCSKPKGWGTAARNVPPPSSDAPQEGSDGNGADGVQ